MELGRLAASTATITKNYYKANPEKFPKKSVIDGNVTGIKNDRVETVELYAHIFTQPVKYSALINKLEQNGFENPFSSDPVIDNFVNNLFTKQGITKETSKLNKALVIMCGIIPANRGFGFNNKWFKGILIEKGGLEIKYSPLGEDTRIRRETGDPMPVELLSAPPIDQRAVCTEFAQLVVVALRSAGISAGMYVNEDRTHAVAIATIAGRNYIVDASNREFEETKLKPMSDREAIAEHYFAESGQLINVAKSFSKAEECLLQAIALSPDFASAMYRLGRTYELMGHANNDDSKLYDKVEKYLKRAVELNKDNQQYWESLILFLVKIDKYDEAAKYEAAQKAYNGSR